MALTAAAAHIFASSGSITHRQTLAYQMRIPMEMQMSRRLVQAVLAASAFAMFGGAGTADAKFRCSEGFQQNSSGEFASPFCETEYLAQVARSYGDHVTANQIRASFSLELQVCRLIGNDNRVSHICERYLPPHEHDRCTILPC